MHGSGARLAPFDSQFVILDLPRFEHSRRCTLRHWSTGHETPKAFASAWRSRLHSPYVPFFA